MRTFTENFTVTFGGGCVGGGVGGGVCNWASACIKRMLIWITGLIVTPPKHLFHKSYVHIYSWLSVWTHANARTDTISSELFHLLATKTILPSKLSPPQRPPHEPNLTSTHHSKSDIVRQRNSGFPSSDRNSVVWTWISFVATLTSNCL